MLEGLDVQRIRLEGGAASRTSQQIPHAPQDPLENFLQFKALKNWDRQRGFIAPQTPSPLSDLYVCWRPEAIYLGLDGWDGVEKEYYRGGFIPKDDRALWSVRIGGKEIARARIGAGREAMVNDAAVRVESIPMAAGSAWMTAAMEVPIKVIGKNSFGVGDDIEIESILVGHAGVSRVEWKGKFKLVE